jgi:hypothetical protein
VRVFNGLSFCYGLFESHESPNGIINSQQS